MLFNTLSENGIPILPAIVPFTSLDWHMLYNIWDVVVLPFDPVIAIIGSFENQLANSISPTMGIFFCAAFNTISESFGMPGDIIHRSAS